MLRSGRWLRVAFELVLELRVELGLCSGLKLRLGLGL